MDAELIVVDGPLLGERFSLVASDVHIGRAPTSQICLSDRDAAWEHAVVRFRDGRHHIGDCHTGMGTYVNGMRIHQHVLESGDQIGVCDTVMVYSETGATAAVEESSQHTLLRACSLMFLFRALAMSQSTAPRRAIAANAVRLIADIVPCRDGVVFLGRDTAELHAGAVEMGAPTPLGDLIARVCAEGSVIDAATHTIALALHVRGAIAGILVAWFPPEQDLHLADHRDTLTAVGTLAGAALENARDVERLQTANALLLDQLSADSRGMVGESPSLRKLQQLMARVAPQDTPVLILGESGTGKELVARGLHSMSARSAQPFVAINCAAISETLLESELFGHEKGAFTGAVVQKKGKLEIAQGGTVFLDEIGELPLSLQAKLLRVLQEREFERVGGTHTLKLDIRLIAATNRDLAAEVRRGEFREDLYHRINVVALHTPPLRERPGDIPALAQHFLARSAARCKRRVLGISEDAERYLLSYSWPGNIRELENAMERAVVLGQSDFILPDDLPETVLESAALPEVPGALQSSVTAIKRQAILAAWQESGGDHRQAAERLNLHPNSLRRLIRNLKLRDTLR